MAQTAKKKKEKKASWSSVWGCERFDLFRRDDLYGSRRRRWEPYLMYDLQHFYVPPVWLRQNQNRGIIMDSRAGSEYSAGLCWSLRFAVFVLRILLFLLWLSRGFHRVTVGDRRLIIASGSRLTALGWQCRCSSARWSQVVLLNIHHFSRSTALS